MKKPEAKSTFTSGIYREGRKATNYPKKIKGGGGWLGPGLISSTLLVPPEAGRSGPLHLLSGPAMASKGKMNH